jgi:hypothetical protein
MAGVLGECAVRAKGYLVLDELALHIPTTRKK